MRLSLSPCRHQGCWQVLLRQLPSVLFSEPHHTFPKSLDLCWACYEFCLTKITLWRMGIFLIELYEPRTAEIKPRFLHPVAVGGFIFHPNPGAWMQSPPRAPGPPLLSAALSHLFRAQPKPHLPGLCCLFWPIKNPCCYHYLFSAPSQFLCLPDTVLLS